jgi:hypothetical protein
MADAPQEIPAALTSTDGAEQWQGIGQQGPGLLEVLSPPGQQRDPGTDLGQGDGDLEAETPGAAGDQGNLAVEAEAIENGHGDDSGEGTRIRETVGMAKLAR